MTTAARFVRIVNRVLKELYRQIDELEQEIDELKMSGEGLDPEAPFDPWRFK